ncbi:uncharacterized protein LOC144123913 [Amblyomma americanum]
MRHSRRRPNRRVPASPQRKAPNHGRAAAEGAALRRKISEILPPAQPNPTPSPASPGEAVREDEQKLHFSMCPLDSPATGPPPAPADRGYAALTPPGLHFTSHRIRLSADQAPAQELSDLSGLLSPRIAAWRRPQPTFGLSPLLPPLPQAKNPRVRFKHPPAPLMSEAGSIVYLEHAPASKEQSSTTSGMDQCPQLRVICGVCACIGIIVISAAMAAHMSRSLLSNIQSPATLSLTSSPEPTAQKPAFTTTSAPFENKNPGLRRKAGLTADTTAGLSFMEAEGTYSKEDVYETSFVDDSDERDQATATADVVVLHFSGRTASIKNVLSPARKNGKKSGGAFNDAD